MHKTPHASEVDRIWPNVHVTMIFNDLSQTWKSFNTLYRLISIRFDYDAIAFDAPEY
jgi:hypothetical protein